MLCFEHKITVSQLGNVAIESKDVFFSKLEIIFCVFLAENNFVNALIPRFAGLGECDSGD